MSTITKDTTKGEGAAPVPAAPAKAKGKAPVVKNQAAKEREAKRAAKVKADKKKADDAKKAQAKKDAEAAKAQLKIEAAASSDFAQYGAPERRRVPLSQISWPTMKSGRRTRPLVKDELYEEKVAYFLANGRFMEAMAVRETGTDAYEGFSGGHRYAAAHEANERLVAAGKEPYDEVDVDIWDVTVNEALQLGTAMNISSRSMTKLEIGTAIAVYLSRRENRGLSMSEAARRFGKGLGTFRNLAALGNATPAVRKALKDGTMPMSIGYAVCRLPQEEQDDWIEVASEKGKIHQTIKAAQERYNEIEEGGETGGSSGKAAATRAKAGPKKMTTGQIEGMLNDLVNGDPTVIGKISVTAQSVAIAVYREVLGLKDVNPGHWSVGFQGGDKLCVPRTADGTIDD